MKAQMGRLPDGKYGIRIWDAAGRLIYEATQ